MKQIIQKFQSGNFNRKMRRQQRRLTGRTERLTISLYTHWLTNDDDDGDGNASDSDHSQFTFLKIVCFVSLDLVVNSIPLKFPIILCKFEIFN